VDYVELNSDQRREAINTQQRFRAWRDAFARAQAYRGSMVWSETKGHSYLMRVAYDRQGLRRQTSLGPRSAATEQTKADFARARDEAADRLKELEPVMQRQAAVNRALGLGRVPLIGARIMRALDEHGLMGAGIRVLGTNALFAYEAAAGVHFDAGMTATEDVDLLLDSRARLSFIAAADLEGASLLRILQRVDKSFVRSNQDFRAVNRHGYLVDLIKPLRDPPWTAESAKIGDDPNDLNAVEIEGLSWHESAPPFETTAIDEKGEPLRMVTSDPRIFAVHKLWLSRRIDRDPIKRRRDREQARAVAALVARHFPHLPFEETELRMLPMDLVAEASPLFAARTSDRKLN
jgi:hypothetical protein